MNDLWKMMEQLKTAFISFKYFIPGLPLHLSHHIDSLSMPQLARLNPGFILDPLDLCFSKICRPSFLNRSMKTHSHCLDATAHSYFASSRVFVYRANRHGNPIIHPGDQVWIFAKMRVREDMLPYLGPIQGCLL